MVAVAFHTVGAVEAVVASWEEEHRETEEASFLDGLDAWADGTLVAYGDPFEGGAFHVVVREDGAWSTLPTRPLAASCLPPTTPDTGNHRPHS